MKVRILNLSPGLTLKLFKEKTLENSGHLSTALGVNSESTLGSKERMLGTGPRILNISYLSSWNMMLPRLQKKLILLDILRKLLSPRLKPRRSKKSENLIPRKRLWRNQFKPRSKQPSNLSPIPGKCITGANENTVWFTSLQFSFRPRKT